MGLIISGIPYKSQYDDDADDFRNDCGPACVAMILNGLGKNVTTNAVYRKTGASSSGYVSVSQMMRAAQTYGINFDYFYPWTLNDLKLSVKAGKAPITLVHYGAWSSLGKTQSSFTGPHFVVVVGYDEDFIFVNDPLWWGTRRGEGERKRWTYAEFDKAWKTASKDGNRNYSGIFCTHSLSVSEYGIGGEPEEPEPTPPPPPVYVVDPMIKRRITAWAAYYGIPLNDLSSPAVVTAYSDAMGDWGLRTILHSVNLDDTLPLISLKYYDDPLKWQVILHFNGMALTDATYDGQILSIPEPLEKPVEIPSAEIPTGGTSDYDKALRETSSKPSRSG